jgi:DNA-binding response OmpR family regulator
MLVLLSEDSRRLRESLTTGLQRSGYAVDAAADGEAGLRYARHNPYDVIILDLMLPKVDGLTVLRRLRGEQNATHVLILTAKDTVTDRVHGLRDGADDYLVKPFAFDELLARIEALVRRSYQAKTPVLQVGPLTIDTGARSVAMSGAPVELSRREYMLLEYLAYRKGQVVDRRQIEDHLYGESNFPMSNAVDRIVCTLRRKLAGPVSGDAPGGASHDRADGGELISTRRGLGYILHEPRS